MKHQLSFSVEEETPVKSIGELKEEFYPLVRWQKKALRKPYRKKKLARILHPQVIVLNPPGYGDPESPANADVYVAVYYRHYYVRIEHGNSMFGPHKLELYFQVQPGQRVWLGTHTAKFNFFSEKLLKKELKLAILHESYYCSPRSADDIVEFPSSTPAIQIDNAPATRTTTTPIGQPRVENPFPVRYKSSPFSSYRSEDIGDKQKDGDDTRRSAKRAAKRAARIEEARKGRARRSKGR